MPNTADTRPPNKTQPLAEALAAVDVTAAPGFDPALARRGWQTLKAARGQNVDLHKLAPAHVIAPAAGWPPMPADATVAEINLRARLRVINKMRAMGLIPRSDLGGAA